jgi:predicted aspartyl protease
MDNMGITLTRAKIKNPEFPQKEKELEFLVDSGAIYSVVPKDDLQKLGIKPHRKQQFTLADGTKVEREMGDAIFELEGVRAASPVVFGKRGDSLLMGAFTLEALGFILDPFKRKLRPMKLLMV